MNRIRIPLAALLLWLFCAAAEAASVTATGQGATERDALHAAMRAAIEQRVGVLVDSRTYVENYRVIRDRIYTRSEGYIAGYDILSSERKNGYFETVIRADVREELLSAELMTRLQKKAVVGANMQDPRVGVIITDCRGNACPAVENAIIAAFQENGFSRIVDLSQIDASVKRRISSAAADGDARLAAMMRSDFHIDYLVTGSLDTDAARMAFPDLPFAGGLHSAAAHLSVRMLNVNTGEVVYAGTADGESLHFGTNAQQSAMKKATQTIIKALSKAALQTAANPEQHVTLLVSGGALGSMSEAYARISGIPGVAGVYTRVLRADCMQIDVDYTGTASDLAQALERGGVAIREMNSEYIRI